MRNYAVLFILPFVLIFSSPVQGEEEVEGRDGLLDAEIVTVGMDHITGSPIVLLRDLRDGRSIPIWIGLSEAQAIIRSLHEIETPRPMTHDLAVDLLGAVGVQVEEVVVHDMRDGIFYGAIYLRVAGRDDLVEVDSRPSDGLALAVRSGAKIRVAEKILEEAPDFDFVPPDDVDQVVQVLGLTVVTASEALREEYSLPNRDGLVVSSVQDEASELGFQRGDFIFRVNDVVPATPMEFLDEVMRTDAAEGAEVHVWRDGEEQKINLPTASDEPEPETEGGIQI